MSEIRNESLYALQPGHDQRTASTTAEVDALHELLTVEEVAALLRVNKTWVYQHTRERVAPGDRRLPFIKIGKYLRFELEAVRTFIGQQKQRG